MGGGGVGAGGYQQITHYLLRDGCYHICLFQLTNEVENGNKCEAPCRCRPDAEREYLRKQKVDTRRQYGLSVLAAQKTTKKGIQGFCFWAERQESGSGCFKDIK